MRAPLLRAPLLRAPLLLALARAAAAARAYSPFTQLTADFLAGTSDPTAKYGPEDKLLAVNGNLVFIDIDQTPARVLTYDTSASSWSSSSVVAQACVPADPGQLVPRDNGYTVGVTSNPLGTDRLIIVGGDLDDNIWFSDDSGVTWQCSSPPQVWLGRSFAPVWHGPGILPGDPLIMAGGLTQETITSVGMFLSYDSGMHWQRPFCSLQSQCPRAFPPNPGFPNKTVTDPFLSIDNICILNNECYLLPEAAIYPGAFASDWNTLWMWAGQTNNLFFLNQSNFGVGWTQVNAGSYSTTNAFGRKVFIRGTARGSGCWFSTDFSALDLYINPSLHSVSSTNLFSTAPSATGPWTVSPLSAPWAPRASAAVTSSWSSTSAWVGGGVTIANGVINPDPSTTFGDVWQVDAGVCLLSPDGSVCSGHGTPDLDNVVCVCDAGFGGDLCDQCLEGGSYGSYPLCAPCAIVAGKGACNEFGGGGVCDATAGCVCNRGWDSADSGCNSCADGFHGLRCTACAPCVNGACDGSGTTAGSGRCVCADGFGGEDCSVAMVSAASAAASAAAAAASATAPSVAVAWLSSLALAAIGVAYVAASRFPAAYAAFTSALGLGHGSAAGRSAESVPLRAAGVSLGAQPAGTRLSPEKAAARLAYSSL